MRYRVALHHDGEGISVSAPGLPRCWCQGRAEAEALVSIADAIGEYLAARDELLRDEVEVRELEVAVRAVGTFPGVNHLHAIQGVDTARFRRRAGGQAHDDVGRGAHPRHPAPQPDERVHEGRDRPGRGAHAGGVSRARLSRRLTSR